MIRSVEHGLVPFSWVQTQSKSQFGVPQVSFQGKAAPPTLAASISQPIETQLKTREDLFTPTESTHYRIVLYPQGDTQWIQPDKKERKGNHADENLSGGYGEVVQRLGSRLQTLWEKQWAKDKGEATANLNPFGGPYQGIAQFIGLHPAWDEDHIKAISQAVDSMATTAMEGADEIRRWESGDHQGFGILPTPFTVKDDDGPMGYYRAMLSAFQKQFDQLPADTQTASVMLPHPMPKGVDETTLLRTMTSYAYGRQFNYFILKGDPNPNALKTLTFVKTNARGGGVQKMKDALSEGQAIAQGEHLARLLTETPNNLKTTQWMVEQAEALASDTLSIRPYETPWIQDQKMGLFLSVAKGNAKEVIHPTDGSPATLGFAPNRQPRFLEMEYIPKSGRYDHTLLLLGKGILFDSGGSDLKIHGGMLDMKGDMGGAAAVIGAMKIIDEMQLDNVRVIGLSALTENRLSSTSSLPRDVVEARGKTADGSRHKRVEIINTDAEGRLTLADALDYGVERFKPDAVVDIATLTGGKVCGVGGPNSVAIMGNNPAMEEHLNTISQGLGHHSEILELTPAHHQWVTRGGHGVADVYNAVPVEEAEAYGLVDLTKIKPGTPDTDPLMKAKYKQSSAQGGAFIREFLPDSNLPWVHLDIAGAEIAPRPEIAPGVKLASGFGVSTLYLLAKSFADGSFKPESA